MITPNQAEVLVHVHLFVEQEGHSPSYEQIQRAIGAKSKSKVARLIDGLIDRGMMSKIKGKSRSLSITEKGQKWAMKGV